MHQTDSLPEEGTISEPFFIAKQPVFDTDFLIWGYELLFRTSSDAEHSDIQDKVQATSQVIADGISLVQDGVRSDQKLMVNFDKDLLVLKAPLALDPKQCVVEIMGDTLPEPDVLQACSELREAGYQLALDNFTGERRQTLFLEYVDLVKIDFLAVGLDQIAEVVPATRAYPVKMAAVQIEYLEQLDLAREMGFDLFQGYFYCKPVVLEGKKLSSQETFRLKILEELSKEDFEFPKLAHLIQKDISLAYRLLKYINSLHFEMQNPISTIEQALTLLGRQKIMHWLRIVLLADMHSTKKQGEILFLSVLRARFLETLTAEKSSRQIYNPDSYFLLGLFSLLDALLGVPMQEIVTQLPLAEEMKQALMGKPNRMYTWLDMAESLERAEWERAYKLLQDLKIDEKRAAELYSKAYSWSEGMLSLPLER